VLAIRSISSANLELYEFLDAPVPIVIIIEYKIELKTKIIAKPHNNKYADYATYADYADYADYASYAKYYSRDE